MKTENIEMGFCVECDGKFLSEWAEPQFTSYYLSEFKNVHIFRTRTEAEKHLKDLLPSATIKEIKCTITREIELI